MLLLHYQLCWTGSVQNFCSMGVPYEGGDTKPPHVCGWYTWGAWGTPVVRGWLERAISNVRFPLAIPSPRDVQLMTIFEIDSSKVLFDYSKVLTISFFIMGSSFISSWSLWVRKEFSPFSPFFSLIVTNFGVLEREWRLLYNFFWPGYGREVSADWLSLEESRDSRVDISKMCNHWIIWGSQIKEC